MKSIRNREKDAARKRVALEKMKKEGIVSVTIFVPEEKKEELREIARKMRDKYLAGSSD